MSYTKQYSSYIILILFFLRLHFCQQQYSALSDDDNINNTSSLNENFTIGKLLKSIYICDNIFSILHTCLKKNSIRILILHKLFCLHLSLQLVEINQTND